MLGEKARDIVFVGCETLRWACRFTEWGRRNTFLGAKENISAAVTPPLTEVNVHSQHSRDSVGVFPKNRTADAVLTNLGTASPSELRSRSVHQGGWIHGQQCCVGLSGRQVLGVEEDDRSQCAGQRTTAACPTSK